MENSGINQFDFNQAKDNFVECLNTYGQGDCFDIKTLKIVFVSIPPRILSNNIEYINAKTNFIVLEDYCKKSSINYNQLAHGYDYDIEGIKLATVVVKLSRDFKATHTFDSHLFVFSTINWEGFNSDGLSDDVTMGDDNLVLVELAKYYSCRVPFTEGGPAVKHNSSSKGKSKKKKKKNESISETDSPYCNYDVIRSLPSIGDPQFIDCGWNILLVTNNKYFRNENRTALSEVNKMIAEDSTKSGYYFRCAPSHPDYTHFRSRIVYFSHELSVRNLIEVVVHEVSHLVDDMFDFVHIDTVDTEFRSYLNDYFCGKLFDMIDFRTAGDKPSFMKSKRIAQVMKINKHNKARRLAKLDLQIKAELALDRKIEKG